MNISSNSLPADLISSVLNKAPLGILVTGENKKVTWCNETISVWLDSPSDELVEMTVEDIIDMHLKQHEDLANVLAITNEDELPLRWVQLTTITDDAEEDHNQILYFRDVSDRINIADRLDQLQVIDPVSGLLNRRAMMQNLEPLVSRSRRYENPLSIIAIELLNLDEIRSSYSNQIADELILALSHSLKDQLRWADIVSRIDDDNIHIVLPETGNDAAIKLAHKISAHISELPVEPDSSETLSACYGVCSWQKGNDSLMMLRNAKHALNKAKSIGPGTIENA